MFKAMPWIIFILLAGVHFCFGQFKIVNSSEVELMRVTSGGDVGIGTATPGAGLEVIGSNRCKRTICADCRGKHAIQR
ncbi:hypothetical protein GF407_14370 [candidate division KSB1 bacterium]|nr:hypothetical protein [candidate division KSB1 bacterium]